MDKTQLQRERAQFNRAIAELIDERLAALPDPERDALIELARDVARTNPRMGAAGAMELLYRLGTLLNNRRARLS